MACSRPAPGPFDLHFDLDHAVLAGFGAGLFGGPTGGERRALSGALEADRAGRRPGDRLTIRVSDGDHRVVERRLHMSDATGNTPLRTFFLRRRFCTSRPDFKSAIVISFSCGSTGTTPVPEEK